MNARCVAVCLILSLALAVSVSLQDTSPVSSLQEELVVKARRFLESLSQGDFEAAAKDFDETMMKVSPPQKLEEFWKMVPNQLGAFKRQTAARSERLGPYDIVLVTCEFEKTTLDARIVFNKDKQISGFQFVPSLPPAQYKEPSYADPALFEEREAMVGSGEWELPGLLTIPKGEGPFPGLVLVHGSGPNDRDETLGPNKPFKDLAWGLSSRGIAVLRYDKRTRVYGPKLVADKAIVTTFTVKEESIDDALEAVQLLKKTEKIDPGCVFVLGHSLGGYLIPRIEAAGSGLGIAGFIIMAGLTRPLEDAYLKQITYIYGLDGMFSEDDKAKLEELKAQTARIKAFTEAEASSDEKILGAAPRYWLDLRGYDPANQARLIKQPLLILQGSRDYQVTTDDFENWKKALAARPEAAFRLYPNLNHLFFEGKGLITPNEYIQVSGHVAVYVIDDIAAWMKKTGT